MNFGQAFGNAQVSTGIDPSLKAPSIDQAVYQRLTAMPPASQSPMMNQSGGLNDLYRMNLLGQNMNNAANLHALENQQTAANNMSLGNLQSALSQRGLGMTTNQALYGMGQQQQLNSLLRSLFGNMFGNLMGMF